MDFDEATDDLAIVATISGTATYVVARQHGTAVEQVEGEGIYEKAIWKGCQAQPIMNLLRFNLIEWTLIKIFMLYNIKFMIYNKI